MSNKDQNEPNTHGGFSESWLSLREPADHAARNADLTDQLKVWNQAKGELRILEMGAGTGSNLRYLIPLLGREQHWQVLDNDPGLIDRLPQLLKPWAASLGATIAEDGKLLRIEHKSFSAIIHCNIVDLSDDLKNIAIDDTDLITASALLDLTSADWLSKLARFITSLQCACLFTLNYNGQIQWRPKDENDATITALLNQHQLTNKGFGKAAGPLAGQCLVTALKENGRQVATADSNWQIGPESDQLQQAIIDGWESAAREQDAGKTPLIEQWHASRTAAIKARTSSLTVGHIDVLSLV